MKQVDETIMKTFLSLALTGFFSEFPNIEVISEGCNDPIRSEGCGLAYIYIDGEQKSPQKRGHNFVVISALTGKIDSIAKKLTED